MPENNLIKISWKRPSYRTKPEATRRSSKILQQKATHDRKPFQPGEPVNMYNTFNKKWETGTVVRQDQLETESRTYTVHKGNKEYRRTREHLKIQKHPVRAATNISTSRTTTNQSPTVNQRWIPGQEPPESTDTVWNTAQKQHSAILINKGQPTSSINATAMQTTRYGRTVKMPERQYYSWTWTLSFQCESVRQMWTLSL